MKVRKASTDVSKQEYGGDFRRLYPWEGVANPPWGGAWMTIAPERTSTPHDHDEEETFLILSGNGEMEVDGERRLVEKGDVIYLPRFSTHKLRNVSPTTPLELLCVWWGAPTAD
jgi:mannose-6-phosphate isomerase-like protein (cupin superfamily)